MPKKIPNSAIKTVKINQPKKLRVKKKNQDKSPDLNLAKTMIFKIQKPQTENEHSVYVFNSDKKFKKDIVLKTKTKKRRFPLSLLPAKGDGIFEGIRKIVFIISFTVMVACLAFVIQYLVENYQNAQRNDYLESIYRSDLTSSDSTSRLESDGNEDDYYHLITGASKLLEINKDVAGYISIPDTEIAYPLMQGNEDNDEYLNTDIYGNSLRAGSIFLDFRCVFDNVVNGKLTEKNSDVLVVYGHNMRDESMFGSLKYYKNDPSYYEEHPIVEFNSNYVEYNYKIFGVFIADPDDKTDTFFDYWNTLNFDNKEEFSDFVNEIKRRTIINTNVDMKYGDQLLILSTCNNAVSDGRLVVAARLQRDGEDLYEGTDGSSVNDNVKMPSSYYGSKGSTYDESKFVAYDIK
jgi:sortase B